MTEPPKRRRRMNPEDWVAIIVAASLGVFLALAMLDAIVEEFVNPEAEIHPSVAQLLAAMLGGMIALLSGYMSHVIWRRRRRDDEEDDEDDPPQ